MQPDVTRAGGITETRRIAQLAQAFDVRYAPHVGFSGAVCVAATIQLAAAAGNFYAIETMVIPNPLREALDRWSPSAPRRSSRTKGEIPVPPAPGLGIDLDLDAIERFRI